MKKFLFSITVLLCTLMSVSQAKADDYADYLTTANGFTEVTTVDELKSGSNYYYVFQSAEDPTLVLANGRHAAKPDWATDGSLTPHYMNFSGMPLTDLNMYYQLEYGSYTNVEGEAPDQVTYTGSGFGMKSAVNTSNFFQTHGNAGYMWVNTFTDAQVDVWDALTPTYANGSWTFSVNRFDGEDYWFNDGGTSIYLGPWDEGQFTNGMAIAANKSAQNAGHFKVWRISKTDYATLKQTLFNKALYSATSTNPVNATYRITNASFETGDTSGWTTVAHNNGNVMPTTNYADVGARDYGFSNHDGQYTYNFYTWWAEDATVSQTVSLPAGIYDVSATVGAWEGRTVTVNANSESQTATGINDVTGVVVTFPGLTVGNNNQLAISVTSTIAWWDNTDPYKDTQNFFKLDNVCLTCKGVYLAGIALPLPNDETTILVPGQWYYYEAAELGNYQLSGKLDNMVYTQNGTQIISEGITTKQVQQRLTFNQGRVYFMTPASDATLKVSSLNGEGATNDFSVCTLNVDGLPESILFVTLNEDGPQASGTREISQYLANKGYDLIAVQEDFNFDEELRSSLTNYDHGTHRGKVTGLSNNTDGLNFFWNTAKGRSASDEDWTQFNHSESGDGNQYIKKGWRYYEVTLAEGMKIDVYMTHMDAGDVVSSRNIQWTELANAVIANENTNRPKIILGDFNSRFTREAIIANFFTPIENTGNYTVSDAWVEKTRSGNYPSIGADASGEVVDKIIYLNPTAQGSVQLTLNSYVRESDYTWGDHNPVVATFTAHEPAVTITPALDRWTWKGETRDNTTEQKWYLYNVQYGTTTDKQGFLSRNNNPRLVSDPNAAGVYPFKFSAASGNATLTSVTENSTYKLVSGNPPTYSTSGTATTFTISEATQAIARTTDKAYHFGWNNRYYVGMNTTNSNNFQRQTDKSASNAWALISTEQVAMYNRFVLASQKATYYAGYLPIDESVKAQMVTLLAKMGVTWTDGTTEALEALNAQVEEWFDDNMTSKINTSSTNQTISGLPEGFYKVKAKVTSANKRTVKIQMGAWSQETPMTSTSQVDIELPLYYHDGESDVTITATSSGGTSTFSNLQLFRYDSYYDETITSAEYATTAIRYNTDVPAGVQVLYVTKRTVFDVPDGDISGSLQLTKYEGATLPQNEGVILYKGGLTANKQFRFYRTRETATAISGNMLKAAVNRIEPSQKESGTYYMLAKKNLNGEPTVGFFELAENTAIKAHKAYLLFDDSSGVKGYIFSFDKEDLTPTAVQQIETAEDATVVGIYSLNGARQDQMQRGINLVRMSDGSVKKVLVK
jgi:hypothetical protein